MTIQGISNSLNMTLARINYLESSLNSLQNIDMRLNPAETQTTQKAENNDFQSVLESKIEEAKKSDIVPAKEISEEIKVEKKDAVNLKSKIDLLSQASNIDEIVETFSQKYEVDSDLIKAIIKQESNFNEKATSKKGAMGLMQLMPQTAKSLGVENPYNPWENVEGGVKYIRELLNKYDNDEQLALAAYNAGPGAVKKYGGIPPYKETQNYVKNIMETYTKVKEAQL